MKKLLFAILLVAGSQLFAQDTLTFLQYNLLNYGNYTSYCTEENNPVSAKDVYIQTIVDFIQPDVFTVNEVTGSQAMHQHLLDQGVNAGSDKYRMANFIYQASPYLVNLLFYNHEKLALHSHVIAQSLIRDIDVYTLYYKSDDLNLGDTAFFTCVVAHLKAGNGAEEAQTRNQMAENTMAFLENYGTDENYLLSGDFNVYTSSEAAYQTFTQYPNSTLRFNDPIDKPGSWNNNASFASVHTQSTHTSSGCASSGGMDDRFDFILMSNNLKFGAKHLRYISGSYRAVGQDGLHFNKNLTDSPTNTSVPADVLSALYENSDHLPVTLKLVVDKSLGISEWQATDFEEIRFNNPAKGHIKLYVVVGQSSEIKLTLYTLLGEEVLSVTRFLKNGSNEFFEDIESLPTGMYLLRLEDSNHRSVTKKLVIN
jgi:endonuclease/exonuclease/phosphatase family metal-dependent hydrolase